MRVNARFQQLAFLPQINESSNNFGMAFPIRLSGVALRVLILCGALSAASTFSQTDRTKLFDREDACIRSEAATHFFRGAVLVGIDGKIVFENAYGLGDYEIADGHIANAEFIDMSVPFSAGGIYSTVEDPYRWNEALTENGKLLSADSLKQMFTEYSEATHEGQHYGYGVVISRLKFGKLLYYHGGGVKGFSSSLQRYPNDRVCIVVLSNLDSYRPWELSDHIASDLFNQPLSPVH